MLKSTGQGEKECFISQPQALLFSFIVPVALLMLFNLFALGNTTTHIVKTRKVRQIACPSIRHFTLTADVVARSLANLQLHCFSSFHFTVSLLSISEKPKSNQSETGWQRSGYLYQNGFSDGYHMDSWVCSKPESFIILVVPVCGFKQSSRHVSYITCIWRFISRLKQKPLVKGPTESHKHFDQTGDLR